MKQSDEELRSKEWRRKLLQGDAGFIDPEIHAQKVAEVIAFEKRLRRRRYLGAALIALLLLALVYARIKR